MAALGFNQIAQAAYQAGFRGQALVWMTAIAMRESSGNPAAYNGNVHTGDNSWGLWQINTLGGNASGIRNILTSLGRSGSFQDLLDPAINAQVAYKLSGGGTNFEPWRSHSPGWSGPQGWLTNATQYLPQAQSAALGVQMGSASQQTTQMAAVNQAQSGQGSLYTQMSSWLTGQLGKPYVSGGRGPNNYDCSGLTAALYQQFGIHMDALTWTQGKYGMAVDVNNMQPGDLILVHGAQGDQGHVGVYMGSGQVVDAPHTGATVRITPLANWTSRAQSVRRIVDSTGALIVNPGGLTPAHDPNVRTVDPSQAVFGNQASLMAFNSPDLLTGTPTPDRGPQNFSLTPLQPFELPGLGKSALATEAVAA
jgi:cell wall-associated NlpC family hydrolase